MTREELIEAGARNVAISADIVAQVIDAVEQLIRADEREMIKRQVGHASLERDQAWAKLRAKVEALPSVIGGISRADVLALFDGDHP